MSVSCHFRDCEVSHWLSEWDYFYSAVRCHSALCCGLSQHNTCQVLCLRFSWRLQLIWLSSCRRWNGKLLDVRLLYAVANTQVPKLCLFLYVLLSYICCEFCWALRVLCACTAACAAYCYQCNSAGSGLCDAGQCHQNYTVAEDKTCQGQSDIVVR